MDERMDSVQISFFFFEFIQCKYMSTTKASRAKQNIPPNYDGNIDVVGVGI